MTRFTATTLDLSRLDPSPLFPTLSFESIQTARINDLKTRLTAAGWEYNVEALESDPGVYLQETGAYRELLTGVAIQDAQKAVLLAFAYGEYLDRLGDLMDTPRQVIQPATDTAPAILEGDDRYRGRIQLAPEKFARAGTPAGYIYHAMEASPLVRDCAVTILDRGTPNVRVEMTILSTENVGVPSADLMSTVRSRVMADDVKLMTDNVVIRPAVGTPYAVAGTLYLLPGPDPTVVKTAAEKSLRAMADRYLRLGGGVPGSAITASAQVAAVDSVIVTSPPNGVSTQRFEFAYLTGVVLKPVVLGS